MLSALILFLGTFWESAMDKIADDRHYNKSIWKQLADWLDSKGFHRWGNAFWDNSISWKNKWKNKDPKQGEAFFGSSHCFVTFMDGWHTVKFVWLIHVFAAFVLYRPITQYLALDVFLFYLIFGIGHRLFFVYLQNKWVWVARPCDLDCSCATCQVPA